MGHMTIPVALQLLIYALAVARVTGLITTDSITEDARDAVIGWLDDRPKTLGAYLATLITCPWCAGMWVSLIAAPLVWIWGDSPVMLIPALALAFSQATGMVSNLGR
jgi:hypothetical protein